MSDVTPTTPKVEDNKVAESDGRTIEPLDVELKAPVSTSKNTAAPTQDASEKKRKGDFSNKKPVATSVAQLRDAGIAEGTAPSTEQVKKMREIEKKSEAELSKQVRLPNSAQK